MNALRDYCHGYFRFARERGGIFRVLFMTRIRDDVPVPVPVRDGPVGEDEGVVPSTTFSRSSPVACPMT
jgi:hypothetical protein